MTETSPTIGALAAALAQAQSSIRNPAFDSANPHYGSRYASLAAHLDALRIPLAAQGLAIVQTLSAPSREQFGCYAVAVTTTLMHSSGEWARSTFAMPVGDKVTAQAAGSTLTYLRRYSLASLGLIAGEPDDDGNGDHRERIAQQAEAAAKRKPKATAPTAPKSPAAESTAGLTPTPAPANRPTYTVAEFVKGRGTRPSAVRLINAAGKARWAQVSESCAADVEAAVGTDVHLSLHEDDGGDGTDSLVVDSIG